MDKEHGNPPIKPKIYKNMSILFNKNQSKNETENI